MDITIPIYLFDTSGDPDVVEKIRQEEAEKPPKRKLRCCSCDHVITDESQRISINNSHSHNRTNPGGIEYHFQCFGNAPGCSLYGQATDEFTWFAGYRWQIAICNSCGEHLGWLFRGESSFFGLIAARIVADEK